MNVNLNLNAGEGPSERTILVDGSVRITTQRAIFGGHTVAVRNITSVRMTSVEPETGGWGWVILVGVTILVAGVVAVTDGEWRGLLACAGGLALMGWAARSIWALKPTFHVRLVTTAGETKVHSSKDHGEVSRIVIAINEAVASCGQR